MDGHCPLPGDIVVDILSRLSLPFQICVQALVSSHQKCEIQREVFSSEEQLCQSPPLK